MYWNHGKKIYITPPPLSLSPSLLSGGGDGGVGGSNFQSQVASQFDFETSCMYVNISWSVINYSGIIIFININSSNNNCSSNQINNIRKVKQMMVARSVVMEVALVVIRLATVSSAWNKGLRWRWREDAKTDWGGGGMYGIWGRGGSRCRRLRGKC